MGTCTYTAARPCPQTSSTLPDFNVEVKNEHRQKKLTVVYTKCVTTDVYGYRIRFCKGSTVEIGKLLKVDTVRLMVIIVPYFNMSDLW